MYTCQCEGFPIGERNGLLLSEVAEVDAFWRCLYRGRF